MIRTKLFKCAIEKDVTYFEQTKPGELINRISSDTNVIQTGLSQNIPMFVEMGCMIIVKLVIMFQFSIAVTLAAILLIIPGALVGPIYGKYNREAVR
jgi:ATP-binding cassette subfamily B (MDR/TAP) protein 10